MVAIVFAGEFGGEDAHSFVRPHFKALKQATSEANVRGADFSELHFILRVDGEIKQYGKSGVGPIDFDKTDNSVSVDLQFTKEDRTSFPVYLRSYVKAATVELQKGFDGVNSEVLFSDLLEYLDRYEEIVAC